MTPTTPKKEYFITESKNFSDAVVFTNINQYRKRNQSNIEKIKKDILFGKYAEFCVWWNLLLDGWNVQEPDCQVYSNKKKSFDADLTANDGTRFHVKSCNSSSTFPVSWLFQPNDPVTMNPNQNDLFVLCYIENDTYDISGYTMPSTDALGKYRAPISPKLNKKVLYKKYL